MQIARRCHGAVSCALTGGIFRVASIWVLKVPTHRPAASKAKNYVVAQTIAQLEQKLDPKGFCRIHRATIVNLEYVRELDAWFEGRLLARLKDEKRTELQVSRDRAQELKRRLGV